MIWSDQAASDFQEETWGGESLPFDKPTPIPSPKVPEKTFGYDDGLLSTLSEDPFFLVEIEAKVEKSIREAIAPEFEKEKKRGYEEGLAAGKKEAADAAAAEWEKVRVRIDALIESWMAERGAVLKKEADLWAKSLAHLLKRFLISAQPGRAEAIANWVQSELAKGMKLDQVKLHLSSEDAELSAQLQNLKGAQWSVTVDSTLKSGDVAVSISDENFIFSKADALAELEQLIQQYVP